MYEDLPDRVLLQVITDTDTDAEQLEALTVRLRGELLDLDVAAVEPLAEGQAPPGSKGAAAAVAGWLVVNLGPQGLKAGVKALVHAISSWAGRNGKTVELSIGGNTLKLTGASAEVQSDIVREFFARQAPTN